MLLKKFSTYIWRGIQQKLDFFIAATQVADSQVTVLQTEPQRPSTSTQYQWVYHWINQNVMFHTVSTTEVLLEKPLSIG